MVALPDEVRNRFTRNSDVSLGTYCNCDTASCNKRVIFVVNRYLDLRDASLHDDVNELFWV